MAISRTRPIDLSGRSIEGNDALGIPKGTDAVNGSDLSLEGIKLNSSVFGLDLYMSGRRATLLPNTDEVTPIVSLSPGDTHDITAGQTVPLQMTTNVSEAKLTVPTAPTTGDLITFYDENGSFNSMTGVVIQNIKIDGRISDRHFKDKNGFYQLKYLGGSSGWTVQSVDTNVPLSTTLPQNVITTDTNFADKEGLYVVDAAPNSMVYPAISKDSVKVGDEVVVIYETPDNNSEATITHLPGEKFYGVPRNINFRRIIIHYRILPYGVYVLRYQTTAKNRTIVEFESDVLLPTNANSPTTANAEFNNVNLSELDYLKGEAFDFLDANGSLTRVDDPSNSIYSDVHVDLAGTQGPNEQMVQKAKWRHELVGEFETHYHKAGTGNGTPKTTLNFNRPIIKTADSNLVNYIIPRIAKQTTVEVSVDDCNLSVVGTENQWNHDDRIKIHNLATTVTSAGITTFDLGTILFTDDEGDDHSVLTMTGPGVVELKFNSTTLKFEVVYQASI